MGTGHTLILSASQAGQLAHLCAAYRSYAWQWLPPSPERNQTMRAVQAIQGRLTERQITGAEPLSVEFTEDERQALRTIMHVLMQVCGTEVPSAGRDQQLESLYVLRTLIERMGRQMMAF